MSDDLTSFLGELADEDKREETDGGEEDVIEENGDQEGSEEESAEEGGDEEEFGGQEEGIDLSGRRLVSLIEREFGVSLSQYADDREALRGLVESKKLVGRREEDATLLREIRKKYGDDFVGTLINLDPKEAAKRRKSQEGNYEVQFDESWLTMVRRDENGDLVPAPGAPPDVVAKLKNFAMHRERMMNAFAKSPKRFVESMILDTVNEIVDSKLQSFGKAYSSVMAKEGEKERWVNEHYRYIYDANDNPTPLGERFFEVADSLLEEHERVYGLADPLVCFKQAWDIVSSKVSSGARGHSAAKRAAVHSKSVKTRSDYKEPQQLFKELLSKEGVSLADAYEAVSKRLE